MNLCHRVNEDDGKILMRSVMKRKCIGSTLLFFIFLFLFFINNPLSAKGGRSYYLDSQKGSDESAGTIEAPWQTLEKIHQMELSPGDKIYFKRGSTFKGGFEITSSGKKGNPILVSAYGKGPAPVFTNPGYGHLNGNAIRISGNHIVVDGLYFYNCPKSPVCEDVCTLGAIFISLGAEHITVKNCEMTKTPVGIQSYGQHILITKNYIHDNHIPIRPHWGPMCIIVCTSNHEISYNRFENYCAPSNEYGHDGGAIEINDKDYGKINISIHHNYSSGNQGFVENIQSDCVSTDWLIAYNVCDDYQSWLGLTNVQRIRVENNTVIRVRYHEGYNDVCWFNEDFKTNDVVFKNNIIVIGNTVSPVYYQGDGTLQHHEYNLYYCIDNLSFENGQTFNVLGTPLGVGEMINDPLFVDFENRDLHLRNGSPAIDAGIPLGHTKDFDQNTVPAGKAPDMGAFEFQNNH